MSWIAMVNEFTTDWAGAMWRASWQGGLAIVLAWALCRVFPQWCWARRLRNDSEDMDNNQLLARCAELCRQVGLRTVPRLAVSDEISSPLLVGVLRCDIVLPSKLAAESTREELQLILAHELAHLKRADLLWAWLPMVPSRTRPTTK
jgi:beta-lactamase regulating signal transducer with metallopeptidase domain